MVSVSYDMLGPEIHQTTIFKQMPLELGVAGHSLRVDGFSWLGHGNGFLAT